MKMLRGAALLSIAATVAAGTAIAGSDPGPAVYPALVNVQLVRAQNLLDHAMEYQDEGDTAKAVATLTATRSHMRKAWVAAKYIIDTAPPPIATGSSVKAKKPVVAKRPRVQARTSGAPISSSPFADQYTTAAGVLDLEHQIAVMAMSMLDTAAEPLLTTVSTTLFGALTARDEAIAYIHSVDTPVAGSSAVRDAVVSGWAATMPGVAPFVDDELTMVDGLRATINLSPGRKRILDAVELQDVKTGRNITKFWPPVVGG